MRQTQGATASNGRPIDSLPRRPHPQVTETFALDLETDLQ
jgi:hypothetical protein